MPRPVELVKLRWVGVEGETVLRLDVRPDATQRYESRFEGKVCTLVWVEGSARALEGQDLLNWWDRRRRPV